MKSAYELAMERLQKESPSPTLSPEQKAALAEVDSAFRAKLAERELFLKDTIAKAEAAGKFGDVLELEQELLRDTRRIKDDWESRKNRIREGRE
jgi:hypothetical protein